jgi:hypothetical protein
MMPLFILLNLLMLISSHLAAYRFNRGGSFSVHLVTVFLIYITQISLSLLFLGLVIRNLGMVWIIVVNVSISLIIIFRLRRFMGESFRSSYSNIRNFSLEIVSARDYFLYFCVLLFAVQVSVLLIKIYYLPPHVWDVFAYHLHPVAEWLQRNFIPGFIDSPVHRLNRNPAGSRLIHFWITAGTGDIRWIELPQFIFGLMVPLTSYALMRKLELKKNVALKYAILIYFIPAILIQSRTCQDHLVLNAATLMVVLFVVTTFYEGKKHLIPLGMAMGITLGVKISGPHIIAVVFLTLVLSKGFDWRRIALFCRENRREIASGALLFLMLGCYWYCRNAMVLGAYLNQFRYFMSLKLLLLVGVVLLLLGVIRIIKKRRAARESEAALLAVTNVVQTKVQNSGGEDKKKRRIKIIAGVSLLVVIGIVVIGYGDLLKKTFLSYHDPVQQFTGREFAEKYPLLSLLRGEFFKNVVSFPFRLKDIGLYTPYTPDLLAKSGFGIQFFVFGLAAFIIMGIQFITKRLRRKEIVGYIFIFPMVLLISYFSYYYSEANYRMFMFFPVFGLILWPLVVERLGFHRIYRGVLNLLILVMLLFNGAVCVFEGNLDAGRWKTVLTLENAEQRSSIKYSSLIKREEWAFIDRYVPPTEPIGYLGHFDSWVFPYYDFRLQRKLYNLASIPGFRLKRGGKKYRLLVFNRMFVKNLKKRGIHYIHLNPQGIRHFKNRRKGIFIDNKRVFRISKYLYYFLW